MGVSVIRVVLMSGDGLELIHKAEIPEAPAGSVVAGVMTWRSRTFVFTHRENPESYIYRETTAVALP